MSPPSDPLSDPAAAQRPAPPGTGPARDSAAAHRPALKVIRGGEPTAEELAALVAVLTAASNATFAAAPSSASGARSAWSNRAARLRRPLHAGPNAWRNSSLPG